MAYQTDKYNTGTVIVNGDAVYNWAQKGFSFTGPDGNVLKTVGIDGNNQARYTRTLKQDDIGQFQLGTRFNGAADPYASTNFNSHMGGSTKSTTPYVTQIVAGPGIYISAPDGRGVVTVSIQPVSTSITEDNLFDIQWTISDDGGFKMGTDLSQFTIGGAQGVALRSRDGVNMVDMSSKIAAAGGGFINYTNATSLQSSEFSDNGVVYFTPVSIDQQDGAPVPDGVIVLWGRLGRTNTGKILIGDGFGAFSSRVLQGGSEITGEDINRIRCVYKSGSFSSALFVILGKNGNIWTTQGLPFDFYDTTTSDGTASPKTWRSEYATSTGIIGEIATNLVDTSFASYRLVAVNSDYKILYSNRTSATQGTWTVAQTTSHRMYSIAYGNGIWIAVGLADTLYRSTDGITWTEDTIGWPGTTWYGIAFGNDKFVAVGTDGHVSFSTDLGVTWTRAVSNTKQNLNAIAYSPTLNKFVAVGNKRAIVTVNG